MAAKTNTAITTDEIQHIITTLAEDYEAKHTIKPADSNLALPRPDIAALVKKVQTGLTAEAKTEADTALRQCLAQAPPAMVIKSISRVKSEAHIQALLDTIHNVEITAIVPPEETSEAPDIKTADNIIWMFKYVLPNTDLLHDDVPGQS